MPSLTQRSCSKLCFCESCNGKFQFKQFYKQSFVNSFNFMEVLGMGVSPIEELCCVLLRGTLETFPHLKSLWER